jgi:hypothetical protein
MRARHGGGGRRTLAHIWPILPVVVGDFPFSFMQHYKVLIEHCACFLASRQFPKRLDGSDCSALRPRRGRLVELQRSLTTALKANHFDLGDSNQISRYP